MTVFPTLAASGSCGHVKLLIDFGKAWAAVWETVGPQAVRESGQGWPLSVLEGEKLLPVFRLRGRVVAVGPCCTLQLATTLAFPHPRGETLAFLDLLS